MVQKLKRKKVIVHTKGKYLSVIIILNSNKIATKSSVWAKLDVSASVSAYLRNEGSIPIDCVCICLQI